jgi:hypothetical protein
MAPSDNTKRLLEELLAQLHGKQAEESKVANGGILRAADGQLLGKINSNKYNRESILNKYGPFGSRYSQTSIFNPYSQYGSKYGPLSINNPMSSIPPEIVVDGRAVVKVSANPRIQHRITPEDFIATLEASPQLLLEGRVYNSGPTLSHRSDQAYIEAADGTFLGKLNPNKYDSESIFNEYGNFGSEYSPISIFNKYGIYGGEYSNLSPFNEYSSTPPKVIVDGKLIGHLTSNEYISPRIDPQIIKQWARENISQYQ